mmetsp:Transcript_87520/g.187789  ORF Transcript_87520/g.187789 Transcript_87520/m.187789 type:complete len:87 (+) Transcript_87520:896-1156(+)
MDAPGSGAQLSVLTLLLPAVICTGRGWPCGIDEQASALPAVIATGMLEEAAQVDDHPPPSQPEQRRIGRSEPVEVLIWTMRPKSMT